MAGNLPTMKDVAQEAGVAVGTVSKVFNGLPVSKEYRERVEKAARELGYEVNQFARGLRAGKTFTVALVLPDVENPFFAALAQHVCAALTRRDHRMLLYITESRPDIENDCINRARHVKVDGVIAVTYNPLTTDIDLPFVSVDCCLSPGIPCVTSENYGGGYMAAERLVKLGCRRLAYLRTGSHNSSETDRQSDGFRAVCRSRQIPCETLVLDDGRDTESLRKFFRPRIAGGALDIDGIFCTSGFLVWQVHHVLKEFRIHVPEDVQIIGFDGISRFGGEGPYCSTIVQPAAQIAETSVNLLLAEDRANLPARVCLPVRYVPGWTTREGSEEAFCGQ